MTLIISGGGGGGAAMGSIDGYVFTTHVKTSNLYALGYKSYIYISPFYY